MRWIWLAASQEMTTGRTLAGEEVSRLEFRRPFGCWIGSINVRECDFSIHQYRPERPQIQTAAIDDYMRVWCARMIDQSCPRLQAKPNGIQRRRRQRMGIDHRPREHGLDVVDILLGSRILDHSMAHQLDGLPCRQAVFVPNVTCLDIGHVRFQIQEAFPCRVRERAIVAAE